MDFKCFSFVIILCTISIKAQVNKCSDELLQVSTIDALLSGIYEGEINVGQLLKFGNFGLGTFNCLDGEMVVLDGVCFQIKADGKANLVSNSLKTPFAAVTFFEVDKKITFRDTFKLDMLYEKIDSLLPSLNYLYAIKIEAEIISAKTRSVPEQKPPYRQLTEITKEQPVFTFKNIKGTLAGFRCPQYTKGLNVPGYHLHLLTEDRKAGGHLLSFVAYDFSIEIDMTDSYRLLLPHDKAFSDADLMLDKEEALKKVER